MTTREGISRPPRVTGRRTPMLTIAYHADARRVGHRASLASLGTSSVIDLSRLGPVFGPVGAETDGEPLLDPYVSRRAIQLQGLSGGSLRIQRAPDRMSVRVDGQPLTHTIDLSAEAIASGVVIELAGRVVLVLHLARAGARATREDLGLIGHSDPMEALRTHIALAASVDVPVLIRGETGTGKELVANAIHRLSRRANKRLVTVNMAAIPGTTAVSQLFGHVRGAFTGAATNHPGYFGLADGGTLFLDEVGATPPDLQPLLLRALESGEIQPVGARASTHADVRLISATDADLETALADGTFAPALLHRVAAIEVHIPPLRERPEDIGPLLAHFIRTELEHLDAPERLPADPEERHPWLPAEVVTALLAHPWPGNVRELKNVGRRLALASLQRDHVRLEDALRPSQAPPSAPHEAPPAPAPATPAKLRPADIDAETLIAALRSNAWALGATARQLGISRTSLYALVDEHPDIQKAGELTRAQIAAARVQVGDSAKALAAHLQVSQRGLKRRLGELESD